ncbi:MAG TPA: hypothetical protein VFJ06_07850, partial [Halococcus sp.]|nr:hypothetical protein [Halococcus sp.]
GGGSRTNDYYYVSVEPIGERERVFSAVRNAVADAADLDGVTETAFSEGPGLSIVHSGFHNSFVRISTNGRMIVSGASERTTEIADLLQAHLDIDFDRRWSNPMRREHPVTGGVRVVLAAVFVLAAVGGGLAVANAGYPSDAYNPVEAAILASYDARAAVSPSMSMTDAAIAKAAFRVTILRETDTEVRWAGNDSASILDYGRDAVTVAATVRSTTAGLQDRALTADQRRRISEVRANLRTAETDVATVLAARAENGPISRSDAAKIREVAAVLRNHRPGRDTSSESRSNATATVVNAVRTPIA